MENNRMDAEGEITTKIKNIIKTRVRPILIMDGGNIEFVGYENGVVRVKLLGHCHRCPLAGLTLKGTVEALINEELDEKDAVVVEALEFEEEEDGALN
jgi:Fe-S cluster biogenesis protein NfuA